jgi:hypothetical protein
MITDGRFTPTPKRREYVAADVNDANAYDERGILRDGFKIRIPIEMMDSKLPIERMNSALPRRAAAGPLVIETGLGLDKHYYPDGTEKPPRTPRIRIADADPYSGNKPGFRDAAAARATVDAGQAAKDSAYSQMCQDLTTAWMPDHLRAADARRVTADARPHGVSDAEWARAEGIRQMCDAWRTQDAPGVQNLPAGRYPLSAGEGNPCSIDGVAGTLQREGEYLVCRAKAPAKSSSQVKPVP